MVAAFVAGMLSAPMGYLMKNNMAAKVIYTILCLIWGYSSCALPFHFRYYIWYSPMDISINDNWYGTVYICFAYSSCI